MSIEKKSKEQTFHKFCRRGSSIIKRLYLAICVVFGKAIAYPKSKYKNHFVMFSQEGEDAILRRLFEKQAIGFYVDIGAHHPQRFSNTFFFYLKGWSGINIEPRPGSSREFDQKRPRDINLEIGIGCDEGVMIYHQFEEPALNTFDPDVAISINSSNKLNALNIPVQPLYKVLQNYLPKAQVIDFMTIDVEGLDEEVAKSNDWNKYRPRYLLIESRSTESFEQAIESSIYNFISSKNYILISKCLNTLIFKDREWKAKT